MILTVIPNYVIGKLLDVALGKPEPFEFQGSTTFAAQTHEQSTGKETQCNS